MADWKVSVEEIEILPHPNAERMDIAKVGMFQLVVGKDAGYKTGDLVVFAPKRSELPDDLKKNYCNADIGISYLRGPGMNRVGSVRLRGELSEGVTIDPAWVCQKLDVEALSFLTLGEDISQRLDIAEFQQLSGMPNGLRGVPAGEPLPLVKHSTHDVEGLTIYAKQFTPGEPVYMTEKLHGSQVALIIDESGQAFVSSKGLLKKGRCWPRADDNMYWAAVDGTDLVKVLVAAIGPGRFIQAYGEVVPAQGAARSYGQKTTTLRLYRIEVDHKRLSVHAAKALHPTIAALWCPVLYEGPFDIDFLRGLASGKENLSGKEIHIREGGVIEPREPRYASERFPLYLKAINPKFKENDDAIS